MGQMHIHHGGSVVDVLPEAAHPDMPVYQQRRGWKRDCIFYITSHPHLFVPLYDSRF